MSQTLMIPKERAETHLMEILDVAEAWVNAAGAISDAEDPRQFGEITERTGVL